MTIIAQTIASASQRDYAWLLTALSQWSGNRTDLAALLPDCVMLAEKRLNADLESRHQEAVVQLSTEAGMATVATPVDTAEIRSFSRAGYGSLDYMPPDQFNTKYEGQPAGAPRDYTVIGSSFYLGPTPDSIYTLSLAFRAYVPALSDSAGTNWLIETFPHLYLAAAMLEVLAYTKNLAELDVWERKYELALDSVNRPDWTTASSMRVRADTRPV